MYNTAPERTNQSQDRKKEKRESPTLGASIESLDFSDNELNDEHGAFLLSLIKAQGERRDVEMWLKSLRCSTAEKFLQTQIDVVNRKIGQSLAS